MNLTLIRTSLRHLWRQKWQTFLLVVGIMLGVAVVIAIDYANESSKKALELSTSALTGSATHQIVASGQLVDEKLFVNLVTSGLVEKASPIVEGYVNVLDLGEKPLLLLGVDPFLDISIRDYFGTAQNQAAGLVQILSMPNRVILAKQLADQNDLTIGDALDIQYEGRSIQVIIAGLIDNSGSLDQQSLQGVMLTDIASAQEILQKTGGLDRIDLILTGEKEINQIAEALPAGLVLQAISSRNDQVESMVSAFQLNLTALSLLALVVGLFLIYNTMTFSVVQRRETIGIFRSLGLYRSEIFKMILFESAIIALIGTGLGILSGIVLGRSSVNLILRTINDLYFVTTVQDVSIPMISIVKGAILGIFATLLVSIPPALEATRVSPRNAQLRSGLENRTQSFIQKAALIAALAFIIGTGLIFLPIFTSLWWAFAATFLIVVGFSILAAFGLYYLLPPLAGIMKKMFGLIAGMSARVIHRSLSRTAIAVSSLMVAISVTIGMTIMIESFRSTVNYWLEETLVGDVYVSVPDQFSNHSDAAIDPFLVDRIEVYPGIQKIDYLYTTYATSNYGDIQVNVITNEDIAQERIFAEINMPLADIWSKLTEGDILVSEPLANRTGKSVGDSLQLVTPDGNHSFTIIGVFRDYASNQGYLMMPRSIYEGIWGPMRTTAISIQAKQGYTSDKIVRDLKEITGNDIQNLIIRNNETLRADVLKIFDQTFAITNALRFVATLVSVIGILSAVILILIDRQKEIGILRAIGIRTKELWQMILTETGLMGLFAGVFAIPTGIVISLILIYVINLRSFGWTIQFHFDWIYLAQGMLIAILSAVLAGVYPLYRVSKMTALQVMRDE